jgi:hypothetical protein
MVSPSTTATTAARSGVAEIVVEPQEATRTAPKHEQKTQQRIQPGAEIAEPVRSRGFRVGRADDSDQLMTEVVVAIRTVNTQALRGVSGLRTADPVERARRRDRSWGRHAARQRQRDGTPDAAGRRRSQGRRGQQAPLDQAA